MHASSADEDIAYESDITTDAGYNYMSAATLKYDAARSSLTKMGDAGSTKPDAARTVDPL